MTQDLPPSGVLTTPGPHLIPSHLTVEMVSPMARLIQAAGSLTMQEVILREVLSLSWMNAGEMEAHVEVAAHLGEIQERITTQGLLIIDIDRESLCPTHITYMCLLSVHY